MWCDVLIAWKSKEWRVECGEMCSVPGARETSTARPDAGAPLLVRVLLEDLASHICAE